MMCETPRSFAATSAIRSVPLRVIADRQADFRAPGKSRFRDAHVVGRDDDGVERLRAPAAIPDVLEQRFARDRMQRLAREAG